MIFAQPRHMCGKAHCSDVEQNPFEGDEHLEHQAVNVSHRDGFAWSLHPGESEARDSRPDVDQILEWTQVVRLGCSETELE